MPRRLNLVVRAEGDPRALVGSLRAHVASLDPNLPIAKLYTMDDVLYEAVAKPRLRDASSLGVRKHCIADGGDWDLRVHVVFGRAAHERALDSDGTWSGCRTSSTDARVRRAYARRRRIALGLASAGVLTIALDRWISRLLFDVGALDPATYAFVIVVTGGVSGAGMLPPRATRDAHSSDDGHASANRNGHAPRYSLCFSSASRRTRLYGRGHRDARVAIAANTVVLALLSDPRSPAAVRGARSASSTQHERPGQSDDYGGFSWREYSAIAKRRAHARIGGRLLHEEANLTGGDRPVTVTAALVTASLLPTLGVRPMLGRFFDESEDVPGDPSAAKPA